MTLLQTLIVVSEKAANVARLCRQEQHLFHLLVQQKSNDEANPRFIEDFKTLADVLVQEMVKHDVGKKFPEMRNYIHGEESNIFTNQLGESIIVEIQKSSEGTSDMLENVLAGDKRAANLLANEVHRSLSVEDVGTFLKPPEDECIDMNSINIWIDPIDSTSEYISGIEKQHDCGIYLNGLQCVTVLIGVYDRKTGNPIMGIINQPFCKNVNERGKRDEAWDHVLEITREKIPDADLQFIKKKVDAIRASFRKELRRVQESKKSGASKEAINKPTLWYFHLLHFTANDENPRQSASNMDLEESTESIALAAKEDEAREDEPSPPPTKRTRTRTSTKDVQEQRQILVKKAMGVLTRQEDEYDALGKTYAVKLRRMPAAKRDIADKLISDVLYKGLTNELTPYHFIGTTYAYTAEECMSNPLSPVTYTNSTPSPAASTSSTYNVSVIIIKNL